jgi:hypothetical protein
MVATVVSTSQSRSGTTYSVPEDLEAVREEPLLGRATAAQPVCDDHGPPFRFRLGVVSRLPEQRHDGQFGVRYQQPIACGARAELGHPHKRALGAPSWTGANVCAIFDIPRKEFRDMIKIYIHREGRVGTEAVEMAPAAVLGEAIGAEAGSVALLEDTDGALPLDATVADAGIADRAHVFTGKREKELVEVIFNDEGAEDSFTISTRVDHVFKWAVKQFGLSKEDAAEHTLAICGTDVIPADDTHLGEVDSEGTGKLCFALIPKHRFEG